MQRNLQANIPNIADSDDLALEFPKAVSFLREAPFPISEILYRGDGRSYDGIFKEGFHARGTNMDLFAYSWPEPGGLGTLIDSAFISTTPKKNAALDFPIESSTDFTYLYEIRPHVQQPINVYSTLKDTITNPWQKEFLRVEQERVFINRINPTEIKGCWVVEQPSSDAVFVIGKTKEYHPNPNYIENTFPGTKLWKTYKIAGGILMTAGVVIDGASLLYQFDKSMLSGNFENTYREASRITGGWTGAYISGTYFAGNAAMYTKALSPPIQATAIFATGLIGSGVGYYFGSEFALGLFDNENQQSSFLRAGFTMGEYKFRGETLYHADARGFSEIFNLGYPAIEKVPEIGRGYVFVSVSRSMEKEVNLRLSPSELYRPDKMYVYAIDTRSPGINLYEELSKQQPLRFSIEDLDVYKDDVAIYKDIKPNEIKGGWEVDIKAEAVTESILWARSQGYSEEWIKEGCYEYTRTPSDTFVANPDYQPEGMRAWNAFRYAGHGLMGFGVYHDSASLYNEYKQSRQSGNYQNTHREVNRIAGGWAGAYLVGGYFAEKAFLLSAPLSPFGQAAATFTAGLVGSGLGYYGLSRFFVNNYDTFYKEIETIKSYEVINKNGFTCNITNYANGARVGRCVANAENNIKDTSHCLQKSYNSQHNFNYKVSATHGGESSQFTKKSERQTHYDSSAEAGDLSDFQSEPISQSDCKYEGVDIGNGICSGVVTMMVLKNNKDSHGIFYTKQACQTAKHYQKEHASSHPYPVDGTKNIFIRNGYDVETTDFLDHQNIYTREKLDFCQEKVMQDGVKRSVYIGKSALNFDRAHATFFSAQLTSKGDLLCTGVDPNKAYTRGYGKQGCEKVKDTLSSQIESCTGRYDFTTLMVAKSPPERRDDMKEKIISAGYGSVELTCSVVTYNRDGNSARIGKCIMEKNNNSYELPQERSGYENNMPFSTSLSANENLSEKYSQNNIGGSSNTNHQENVGGYEHGTGVYERVGVDFNFNGQHYSMETGIGLEINVGTENNAVVSTNCRDGYCNITLRAGNDRYVDLHTPYHPINSSNSRNNKDAGVERLKNDLNILSKTNHSSGVSDNSIFSGSNSTSRMMDSLRSLNDSQHDFNRSLTTSRVDNFSQFTNQSRETYYFSSANEAERYSSFFSNYISGDFRQTPPPVSNNHSFFGGWGGSNGGKSEYCDAFGNCYSSGGGNNCHDSGSSRCESSIKF